MKQSDLSAIAISNGPGSYTGLRVGASVAKGMCYALGIPLIAIPTLQSLAWAERPDRKVLATIDARRMEVFACLYDNGIQFDKVHSLIWSKETAEQLSSDHSSLIICGNGIEKGAHFFDDIDHIKIRPSQCSAIHLVDLAQISYTRGEFVDVAYHDPFYFKSPHITTPKKVI